MQVAMAVACDGAKTKLLRKLFALKSECERIGIPMALEGKTRFFGRQLAVLLKQSVNASSLRWVEAIVQPAAEKLERCV